MMNASEMVWDLIRAGLNCQEIGRRVGISRQAVHNMKVLNVCCPHKRTRDLITRFHHAHEAAGLLHGEWKK